MPLRYYPLTRVITNLYTRGAEYKTPDGKRYTGRYYMTYDGSAYTGVNPALGTNIKLIPAFLDTPETGRTGNKTTAAYTVAQNAVLSPYIDLDENVSLTELIPYYPIPIESDYQRGYFTRYFAKTVSGPGYVLEISPEDWTKIQNGNIEETTLGYETVDLFWQLTGPLRDTRVSQYQIKGGVYDTNKRVVEGKNKVFRGLTEFINEDYVKFARITP